MGHGRQTIVYQETGIDYKTVAEGMDEIKNKGGLPCYMIRKAGGGRKKMTEKEPVIPVITENPVNSSAGGDPESPLKRTCRSSYNTSEELKNQGYKICQKSVYTILTGESGCSMQADRKKRR